MSEKVIKMLLGKQVDHDFRQSLSNITKGNYMVHENAIRTDDYENPIKPEVSSWQTVFEDDTEKLIKVYRMHDVRHVLFFINELIKESNSMNHHPVITINHKEITVVLYTHDLNQVTESDIVLSKFCDELYEDIIFINVSEH